MRKMLALLLCLLMAMSTLTAVAEEATPVKTGLSYQVSVSGSKDGAATANIALTAVTVDDNGVITACVIDYVQATVKFDEAGQLLTDATATFLSKNELGDAYGMRGASSISAEWNEQAAAFANYCVGKTVEEVKAAPQDEKGRIADLTASCTMGAYNFLPGVEDAVAKAQHLGAKKGDALYLVQLSNASGSKSATAEANGLAQVYTHVAVVTMAGDVITSCYIDASQAKVSFDATGKIVSDIAAPVVTKNVLQDGYGMRARSGIGKEWFEQAAGFCTYVTGKTPAEVAGIAVNESGKTTDADLAATTTIGIADFQSLIALLVK